MIRICFFVIGCAALTCGCGEDEALNRHVVSERNVVSVRVLEKSGQCVVSEHQFACNRARSYLMDQLRLDSDTVIDVVPENFGNPGQHATDVAAQLRQAGFERVAIGGFSTYPGPDKAFQRAHEDSSR
jgi:DNA topoisomerase IB